MVRRKDTRPLRGERSLESYLREIGRYDLNDLIAPRQRPERLFNSTNSSELCDRRGTPANRSIG